MDWYDLFKSAVKLMIMYFNMKFTFHGVQISVASVFVFVGLVSLTIMIIRGLCD